MKTYKAPKLIKLVHVSGGITVEATAETGGVGVNCNLASGAV